MKHFLFLSHSGNDSEAALALARRLEESPEARDQGGLKVWFDKRDLATGTRWKVELEQALAKATAFVVYTGSRGIANWVRDEVDVALDRAHQDLEFPLIPVLAPGADAGQLPGFLAQYQGVFDVEGNPAAFAQLLRGVLRLEARAKVEAEREPFLGLNAFESSKAHLFFGRKEETQQVLDLLREESLVMVTGDSGSGKSSLVKAGVVPAFRGGALAPPREKGPDETVWYTLETRPGLDPFQSLADQVLLLASRLGKSSEEASSLAKLVGKKDPDDVRNALLLCSQPPGDRPGKLLLVVDQFEEIRSLDDAGDYVATLLRLAKPGENRIRVVLTMRRDYYYICSSFPELYERLERNQRKARFLLRRMSPEGLRACVIEPLALTRVSQREREDLAEVILKDVGDEAGELALLEMALDRTWSARQRCSGLVSAYVAIGRVEGALAQAAEEVFCALSPEEQGLAEPLFVRLVWPGESAGVTRRIARLGEFEKATQDLARKLADKEYERLLTLGEDTVEMTHEQLATQWVRCQAWVSNKPGDSRGDDLRMLQGLITDALRWQTACEEEKDDCLATGVDLRAYRKLAEARPSWLTAAERLFLEKSFAAHLDEERKKVLALETAEKLAATEVARRLEAESSERKSRRLSRVAASIAVVALLAATVAGYLFVEGRKKTISIEAGSLWQPLEFFGRVVGPAETVALRQVALADEDVQREFLEQMFASEDLALRFSRAPERVVRALQGLKSHRGRIVEQLLKDWDDERKAKVRGARVDYLVELEASEAVDLGLKLLDDTADPVLNKDALFLIERLPTNQVPTALDRILSAMSQPQLVADTDILDCLGKVLVSNATRLSSDQLEMASSKLLSYVRNPTASSTAETASGNLIALLGAIDSKQAERAAGLLEVEIKKKNELSVLTVLASGLERAAKQLGSGHVEVLAANFLEVIPERRGRESLGVLKSVYAAQVAAKVPPNLEAGAVEPLLEMSRGGLSGSDIPILTELLTAVTRMVKAEQRSRALDLLVSEIASPKLSQAQFIILGDTLASVGVELSLEQSSKLTAVWVNALDHASESGFSKEVARIVGKASSNLTEAQAARVVDLLVKDRGFSEFATSIFILGSNLKAVAQNLPSEEAERAAEFFLEGWNASYSFEPGRPLLIQLTKLYIPELLDRMARDEAIRFIGFLRKVASKSDRRFIGEAFVTAISKLEPDQRRILVTSTLANLDNSKAGDEGAQLAWELDWLQVELTDSQWERLAGLVSPDLLSDLGVDEDRNAVLATFFSSADSWTLKDFIALARNVPHHRASALADITAVAIRKTADPSKLANLLEVLLAVASRMPKDEAAAVLFEVLKDPGLDRYAVMAGIRERFKDLSPPKDRYWALIEWARNQFPQVDFDSPPEAFAGGGPAPAEATD